MAESYDALSPDSVDRAMSLFPEREAETYPAIELLFDKAFEAACRELQEVHHIDTPALALMIDPLAFAIVDYFDAGQRDLERLATYAVACALGTDADLQPRPRASSSPR